MFSFCCRTYQVWNGINFTLTLCQRQALHFDRTCNNTLSKRYCVCRNCPFESFTKQQINISCSHKKKGRGSNLKLKTFSWLCWTACVVKWHDNRAVTLLSTYEAVNLTTELLRWDRKKKEKKVALQLLTDTTNSWEELIC